MMSVVRMRPSVICVNPWGTACCSVSVICWKRVDGHRLSGNLFDGIEPDCKPAAKADRHHRLLRARQRAKVLVAKAAGPMAADPAGSQTQRSPEARTESGPVRSDSWLTHRSARMVVGRATTQVLPVSPPPRFDPAEHRVHDRVSRPSEPSNWRRHGPYLRTLAVALVLTAAAASAGMLMALMGD